MISRCSWLFLMQMLLVLWACIIPQSVPAQSGLFGSGDAIAMTLELPYARVNRSRGDQREYFPATLKYPDASGAEVAITLRVRTRGRSRSQEDTCRYPPLRLNFDKDALQGTLFDGENILKLVTHCQSQSRYDQFVLREMLAYRLLNLLSDHSFRVRQIQMTYIDTDTGNRTGPRAAFVIEDEAGMAARLGLELFEAPQIRYTQYDPAALNQVELFEYLIGNTDWSAFFGPANEVCCHNIVPLIRDGGRLIPVPYDFDATGIVDAPYSIPSPTLGIRSVRERVYRGICHPEPVLEQTIARFIERRDHLRSLVADQAGLTQGSKDEMLDYIDQFYGIISDPAQLRRRIQDVCRN